jgi:hypothetical protein
MPNQNITSATREYWARTVKNQVMLNTLMMAALIDRKRMTLSGTKLKHTIDVAEVDSLGQSYSSTDTLNGGSKTFLDTAEWGWKLWQLPIPYGVNEEIMNQAGGRDVAPAGDLVSMMVAKAQRGMKIFLQKQFYAEPSSSTDSDPEIQSIPSALDHFGSVATYGGVTRSATSNWFWNGASIDGTYTDRNDNYIASIDNYRKGKNAILRYMDKSSDLIAVMGSTLFDAFRSQVEARHTYERGNGKGLAKYGFETMYIDNVEFVKDPMLDTDLHDGSSGSGDYTQEWFFLLNLKTWEFRLSPKRAMKFTGFTWQGDMENGTDSYLARILGAGNLACTQPNANLWLSYMTVE